ncbi:MAG: hypothetical protein M3R14_02160 [Acidobacteriota bacterium]|nr:hypothetical protein [Acidobacteriota bacterium]
MIKKFVSILLAVLLLNAGMGTVYAKTNTEKEARYAEKVKQAIAKLGTGEMVLVKIKLRDKTKLEGFVSAIGDDSFVVTDIKTGVATTVAYPQVKKVKGNNLSTGAKIAIGVGIAVAILVVIIASGVSFGRGGRRLEDLGDAF